MEEERKGVQEDIDKEKRVSPVLEVKVYLGDHDQLDQHVAVALDGEEEKETKKQEDYSVLDESTVKDPEQVMDMVVEKKEKITKIIIQGFDLVRPPPPGYCWASPIDINDSSQLGVVNRMARFAVEYYNKKYKRKVQVQQFGQ
ncbi:hypothetical protein D5086_023965 [Populus alba]|uniref:Uncharacterized protein n=1 Tax=Populus alba TaxID=43335 RepID=A0ACC4B5P0_POPAL